MPRRRNGAPAVAQTLAHESHARGDERLRGRTPGEASVPGIDLDSLASRREGPLLPVTALGEDLGERVPCGRVRPRGKHRQQLGEGRLRLRVGPVARIGVAPVEEHDGTRVVRS